MDKGIGANTVEPALGQTLSAARMSEVIRTIL